MSPKMKRLRRVPLPAPKVEPVVQVPESIVQVPEPVVQVPEPPAQVAHPAEPAHWQWWLVGAVLLVAGLVLVGSAVLREETVATRIQRSIVFPVPSVWVATAERAAEPSKAKRRAVHKKARHTHFQTRRTMPSYLKSREIRLINSHDPLGPLEGE